MYKIMFCLSDNLEFSGSMALNEFLSKITHRNQKQVNNWLGLGLKLRLGLRFKARFRVHKYLDFDP